MHVHLPVFRATAQRRDVLVGVEESRRIEGALHAAKQLQMCVQFSAAELQHFHAVKSAFDKDDLLNPGKAVPTLTRCAELGGMHVHGGKLPFPELERF